MICIDQPENNLVKERNCYCNKHTEINKNFTKESFSLIADLSCERRNSYNLAIVLVPFSFILLFFNIGAFPAAFN